MGYRDLTTPHLPCSISHLPLREAKLIGPPGFTLRFGGRREVLGERKRMKLRLESILPLSTCPFPPPPWAAVPAPIPIRYGNRVLRVLLGIGGGLIFTSYIVLNLTRRFYFLKNAVHIFINLFLFKNFIQYFFKMTFFFKFNYKWEGH